MPAATASPPDSGAALLQLLQGHRIEGFERSFKMAHGSLLADRYLVGIHKSQFQPATLRSLCARMGMPEPYLAALMADAETANAVHFGFEGGEAGGLYKVYLEFAARLRQPLCALPADGAVVLHIAYKWSVPDSTLRTIASYECHPRLTLPGMLERVAKLYAGHADRSVLDTVREIVGFAARRSDEVPMYLEVHETGNPRASFDINLHAAEMSLAEGGSWLSALRAHYAIDAEQFGALYEQVKHARLGHLSGGINRHGQDFLTVYYATDMR